MKLSDLPEFAKKYKVKGFDVIKRGNEFYQYKIEHYRTKDKNYPVAKYIYIGKIDKDKGLIKSSVINEDNLISYLEYGLSNFIFLKFRRSICRSLFNTSAEFAKNIIKIAIISYIFSNITITSLSSSFLTYNEAEYLYDFYLENKNNETKINKIINKINILFASTFIDKDDMHYVIYTLRNMNVTITSHNEIKNDVIPSKLKEIFIKYGVKYE